MILKMNGKKWQRKKEWRDSYRMNSFYIMTGKIF